MNYLKIEEYNGYDDLYSPIREDGTWGDIISQIEQILDDKWFANGEKVAGIKVSFEIVDSLPEGVDFDDY